LWLWRPDEVSAEREIESRQQVNELQEVLDFLPDSDREILILRFYEDLSNAESATIMGCSVHTLYVRTHRALIRLRKELERVRNASREAFEGE
jgi:RNA polymerase sigma-70 factor (ECF subfamily)